MHAALDADSGPAAEERPLSGAEAAELLLKSGAVHSVAIEALVLKEQLPWSPETHSLFPAAARAYAVQLMLIGHSKSAWLPSDLWMQNIMPYLVERDSKRGCWVAVGRGKKRCWVTVAHLDEHGGACLD